MDTLIYVPDEEGNLALIAEADPNEADGNVAMLIDLMLDSNDELEDRTFRVISEHGVFDVEVESDEYVNPRRPITVEPVSSNGATVEVPAEVDDEEDDDDEEEEVAKPRRGRPPGSGKKKRGPGRPPGSKNKKSGSGRGPGRPKGSTNKTKASTKTASSGRGPGRPKGSKNKSSGKRKVKASSFKRTGDDE